MFMASIWHISPNAELRPMATKILRPYFPDMAVKAEGLRQNMNKVKKKVIKH